MPQQNVVPPNRLIEPAVENVGGTSTTSSDVNRQGRSGSVVTLCYTTLRNRVKDSVNIFYWTSSICLWTIYDINLKRVQYSLTSNRTCKLPQWTPPVCSFVTMGEVREINELYVFRYSHSLIKDWGNTRKPLFRFKLHCCRVQEHFRKCYNRMYFIWQVLQ